MTIEEAIKEIQEDGIDLGAGDYVDVEALKVAVETMKDYLNHIIILKLILFHLILVLILF